MSSQHGMEDDLESQSSRSSIERERVWVNMPKAKKKMWLESVGTDPVCIGGAFHDHPLLAAARFVLERQACLVALEALNGFKMRKEGSGVVCDIGSAPKRTHQYLGARGHYMIPDCQPGDRTRFNECPSQALAQVCRCKYEACEHLFDQGGGLRFPAAFVSVHSAYYLDRLVLWRRLQDPLCAGFFAVGHHFDEPYGGFEDEAFWEQHGSSITMRVKGQLHSPYQHDILPWTLDWRGPNGEAFECEPKRSIMGFTTLWEVRAVVRTSSPAPDTFKDVVANERFWGPVQFSNAQRGAIAINSRLTNLNLDLDHVEKIGKILYTTATPLGGEPVHVCLPVDLVSKLASRCVNHERDPHLMRDLTFRAQSIVEKCRVPVGSQPLVITAAVALGMVINISAEVDAGHTVMQRFGWLFKAHRTVMAFQELNVWKCWRILLWSMIVFSPPFIMLFVERNREVDIFAWLIGFVVWLGVIGVSWGAVVISREIASYSTARWRHWYDRGYATHSPLFSVPSLSERLLPGSDNVRDPGDVAEGTRIVLREDTRCPTAAPVTRAFIAGLVADTASVNVTEPTQESELSAITHRLGRPKPELDWKTLNKARGVLAGPEFRALTDGFVVDDSPAGFYAWLNGQRQKYSASVVKGWQDLWQKVDKALVKRNGKPFQKIELNGKPVVPGGQAPVKARVIQPPSDEAKVITAPAASQMYGRCRKVWDGLSSPILYASGRTTDYIGRVVDNWINYFGGEGEVVGLTFDCSDYDTTLRHPQQFAIADLYVKFGVPIQVIGWFFETVAKGITPHGVEYSIEAVYCVDNEEDASWFEQWLTLVKWEFELKCTEVAGKFTYVFTMVDFQMNSGRMDTNLMDTLFNAFAFFSYIKATRMDVRMMVCGDDNFMLMRSKDCTDTWFEGLQTHLRLLGLDAKGSRSANRADWEFCSKLFWFGVDRSTGISQTVLGPKPGRALSRIGITVSVPSANNIAATANSLKTDANHVPFIRMMAKRTYELCVQEKIRAKGKAWEGLKASKAFDLDPRNFAICRDRYGVGLEGESELTLVLASCHTIPMFYHWEPLAGMALRDAE